MTRLSVSGFTSAITAVAMLLDAGGTAAAFPEKPVRLVVPYAPGGATDVLARMMARKLTDSFKQQIIVDNRPGGGTVIGTQIVATGNPDGHTLLMAATPLGINPALLEKLPYDTLRDLRACAFVAFAPVVMVAHPSIPAKTPQELIAAAKAKPGAFTVATPGAGSMGHLTLELLSHHAGIELRHIPYKGAGQAVADVISGQVSFLFDNVGPAKAQIAAGRTRAIAVATLKRSQALPDVPTFDEAGLKGFEANSWFALFSPARTPTDVVRRINVEANAAVASAELKDLYVRDGYEARAMTPEELDRFLRSEIAKWSKLIAAAGIKLQ